MRVLVVYAVRSGSALISWGFQSEQWIGNSPQLGLAQAVDCNSLQLGLLPARVSSLCSRFWFRFVRCPCLPVVARGADHMMNPARAAGN